MKIRLIRKDLDARKDGRQKEKGAAEDEMVGWHYRISGHKFEQTLGNSEGQGSLACCSPWGHRVRHKTEQQHLNMQPLIWRLCPFLFQPGRKDQKHLAPGPH